MDTVEVNATQRWAERGLGTAAHHRIFYWLMRFGGMARGYHLANMAAAWYVVFYPSIRRRCLFYLQRRFPFRSGYFQRVWDSFRLVRAYATSLVDIKVRAMFGAGKIEVEFPEREKLGALREGALGFVLIQAHVGCWQVALSTLGHFEKHVSVVMIPDRHTMSMFDPKAVSVIDPRNGLESSMAMTQALLAGNILVLMGDRTIGSDKSVVGVEFLGKEANFPVTPYRMASATGVPVVVMMAPRVGKRRYELSVARVISVPPGLGRKAEGYLPFVREFVLAMEEFVGRYPWQYYNFFDVWGE